MIADSESPVKRPFANGESLLFATPPGRPRLLFATPLNGRILPRTSPDARKYDRCWHAGEQIAQGCAAPSAPDSGHQAQGLDIDVLAAVVEIEEPAGPVLAQLIAAGMPARWPWPFSRQHGVPP